MKVYYYVEGSTPVQKWCLIGWWKVWQIRELFDKIGYALHLWEERGKGLYLRERRTVHKEKNGKGKW